MNGFLFYIIHIDWIPIDFQALAISNLTLLEN